jgi:hypothetical protein
MPVALADLMYPDRLDAALVSGSGVGHAGRWAGRR